MFMISLVVCLPNGEKSFLQGPTILSLLGLNHMQENKALLIVAEDIESDVLAMLAINKHRAGVKVIYHAPVCFSMLCDHLS